MAMIDAQQDYLTVEAAARRLQVSQVTVWRWIRAGKLRAYRLGPKAIRIMEADLTMLLQPVSTSRDEAIGAPNLVPDLTRLDTSPLTEAERQRGLAVLRDIDALQERMRARLGDAVLPSSVELIREMREERSRDLENL